MKHKILLLSLLLDITMYGMEEIELKPLGEKISVLRFVPDNNTKKSPLYLLNRTQETITVAMEALSINQENQFYKETNVSLLSPGQVLVVNKWKCRDAEKFFIWDEDGIQLHISTYDHYDQHGDAVSIIFKSKKKISIKNPGAYALQERDASFMVEPVKISVNGKANSAPTNRWSKLFTGCFASR